MDSTKETVYCIIRCSTNIDVPSVVLSNYILESEHDGRAKCHV